jgi:uncharacterized caspase-like protein/TPR repeat protein
MFPRLGKAALSFLLPCVLLLGEAPVAPAPNGERGSRPQQDQAEARVALVIGNGAYKDAPLKNPVNDARAVGAALQQCGFQVTELENANREQMVQALRDFGGRIMGGGVGLFYYAGHGMQVRGKNYLVPVDADIATEDEVAYNTLDADAVLAKMDSAKNRLNLVILDACRNNPFGHSFRSAQQGLAQMDAPAGSYVAFATAPGRTAADGAGVNGLYTQHLLTNLRTPGLRVEDVFKRVRASVMQETKGQQVPWENSSIVGDFYFVPGAASSVEAAPSPTPVTLPVAVATSNLNVKRAPEPNADEAKLMDRIRVFNGWREVEELAKPLAAKGSIYGQFALDWLNRLSDKQVYHKGVAKAANQGIPLAMVYLAWTLAETAVTPEDQAEARNWLNKAMELGEPQAKLTYGELAFKGKLGPRDIPAAEHLLAEAAREYPAFCSAVGSIYMDYGEGVLPKEEAVAKGVAYYKRAAEYGDVGAMDNLGYYYFNGDHVAKDLHEGLRWLIQAGNHGSNAAMLDLGTFYWETEDPRYRSGAEAIQWFAKAAEKGDDLAAEWMGDMYRDGKAIPQDLPRALTLYRGLAEKGYREGMARLGEMYEKGLSVTRDSAQAYFWFVLGMDNAYAEAGRERLTKSVSPGERAKIETRAAEWRRTRAEKGSHGDQYWLGVMYEKGVGVPQSLPQAYFWHVLAGEEWPWGKQRLAGQLPAAERARIEAQAAKWKPKK